MLSTWELSINRLASQEEKKNGWENFFQNKLFTFGVPNPKFWTSLKFSPLNSFEPSSLTFHLRASTLEFPKKRKKEPPKSPTFVDCQGIEPLEFYPNFQTLQRREKIWTPPLKLRPDLFLYRRWKLKGILGIFQREFEIQNPWDPPNRPRFGFFHKFETPWTNQMREDKMYPRTNENFPNMYESVRVIPKFAGLDRWEVTPSLF